MRPMVVNPLARPKHPVSKNAYMWLMLFFVKDRKNDTAVNVFFFCLSFVLHVDIVHAFHPKLKPKPKRA